VDPRWKRRPVRARAVEMDLPSGSVAEHRPPLLQTSGQEAQSVLPVRATVNATSGAMKRAMNKADQTKTKAERSGHERNEAMPRP
jgi:hypothetical protein